MRKMSQDSVELSPFARSNECSPGKVHHTWPGSPPCPWIGPSVPPQIDQISTGQAIISAILFVVRLRSFQKFCLENAKFRPVGRGLGPGFWAERGAANVMVRAPPLDQFRSHARPSRLQVQPETKYQWSLHMLLWVGRVVLRPQNPLLISTAAASNSSKTRGGRRRAAPLNLGWRMPCQKQLQADFSVFESTRFDGPPLPKNAVAVPVNALLS
jgi:hypothetical protein